MTAHAFKRICEANRLTCCAVRLKGFFRTTATTSHLLTKQSTTLGPAPPRDYEAIDAALAVAALAVVATSNAELNSTEDDTLARLVTQHTRRAASIRKRRIRRRPPRWSSKPTAEEQSTIVRRARLHHRAITVDPNHASTYNNLANTIKRLDAGAINCGNKPCERDELTSAAIYSLARCSASIHCTRTRTQISRR